MAHAAAVAKDFENSLAMGWPSSVWIPSHGQTNIGQCGFNQAALHRADPIKRHRARRERSHPKEC
jgi:hypothetical protein